MSFLLSNNNLSLPYLSFLIMEFFSYSLTLSRSINVKFSIGHLHIKGLGRNYDISELIKLCSVSLHTKPWRLHHHIWFCQFFVKLESITVVKWIFGVLFQLTSASSNQVVQEPHPSWHLLYLSRIVIRFNYVIIKTWAQP